MCGRYAASRKPEDLVEEFEVEHVSQGADIEPDYNVAPTKPVYAVLERSPRGSSRGQSEGDVEEPSRHEPAPPVRQLRAVTWGLVPSWAKDPSIGSRMINARVETVAEKPAYRRAFATRRCLLPADGYYEWYGEQRGRKQPFFIRPRDGGVLAMAGLYELWRDRSRADDDPVSWLWTCVVITTRAEDSLGRIHDRMPMLVEPERYAAWLDPSVDDPDSLRSLLVPASPDRLEAYPVSTEVNNVVNNGPQLVEPVPLEDARLDGAAAGDGMEESEQPRLF
jgi:putative SOS response-associated peptidase YedK